MHGGRVVAEVIVGREGGKEIRKEGGKGREKSHN